MPSKSPSEPEHLSAGIERLVDKCFRQLRYDNTHGLKDISFDAMQRLLREPVLPYYRDYEYSCETSSGARYLRFRKVAFEGLSFHESKGLIVRLGFECPAELRGRQIHLKKVLEPGMLVGLIGMNKETGHVTTTFFQTHLRESTEAIENATMNDKNSTKKHERGKILFQLSCTLANLLQASIQLSFAESGDTEAIRNVLYHLRGLLKASFVLVDFGTVLPAGFVPHLKGLQMLAKWPSIAFEQHVAPADPKKEQVSLPPRYATKKNFEYDLSPLQTKQDTSPESFKIRPMSNNQIDPHTLDMITKHTTLDKGQALSLYEVLSRGLAFTQGPPGTGKSFLGVALIRVLLASFEEKSSKPIIAVCQTNHALDSFLEDLVKKGVTNIARIGGGCVNPVIQDYDYQTVCQKALKAPKNKFYEAFSRKQRAVLESEGIGFAESLMKGKLGWCALKDHLRVHHPSEFRQLSTQPQGAEFLIQRAMRYGGFVYEFWSNGGDINNMEQLLAAADTLLGSCELKGESDSLAAAVFKEKLLKTIESDAINKSRADPIWTLSISQRNALISKWIDEMNPWQTCDALAEVHRRHHVANIRWKEATHHHQVEALSKVQVIGLTTSGLASHFRLIEQLEPEVALMEEAGEVLEAHSLIALALPSLNHFISIGDPEQLKPHLNQMELSSADPNGRAYSLDVSLFGRLTNSIPTSRLSVQWRMHPDIADISRATIYPFLEDHESTLLHPTVSGIADRTYFLDHHNQETRPDQKSSNAKSYQNDWEANMIAEFVHYLIKVGGYSLGQIAVITPYNGQLAAVTSRLQQTCSIWLSEKDREEMIANGLLSSDDAKNFVPSEVNLGSMLRIATVDNFQGEEASVVIFTSVRNNENDKRGFLEITNRINVACSRARDGFYILGNSKLLNKFGMWEKITNMFKQRGRIGSALRACCPRHPASTFEVAEPCTFKNVPTCSHPCLEELPCGHICQLPCHQIDEHYVRPCLQHCQKEHPCGHKCSNKCGLPCGDCTIGSSTVQLDCGHDAHRACGDIADGLEYKCTFEIEQKQLGCGHSRGILCSERGRPLSCTKACGGKLPCGHNCNSNCKDCQAVSGHAKCQNKCERDLPCGHKCEEG